MGRDNPLYDDELDRATWTKHHVEPPEARRAGEIDLCVDSPFSTIWNRPAATIRAIVETDPAWHVVPLAMLTGVAGVFDRAARQGAGDRLSFQAILAIAILGGPLGGLLGLYVSGWMLRLAGRWLGGTAGPDSMRAALAWSAVPILCTIPISIIRLVFIGRESFTGMMPDRDSHPALALADFTTWGVGLVLRCWSFAILIRCIAEVQGFSARRALGSFMLTMLFALIPTALWVTARHLAG